jgi:hypothetical protein
MDVEKVRNELSSLKDEWFASYQNPEIDFIWMVQRILACGWPKV